MRILNDTEMNVAAGGFACLPTFPDTEPLVRPDDLDEYWLRHLLIEPEFSDELFD